MDEKTVGQLSVKLAQKELQSRDPIELQREMLKEYEENVIDALQRGLKEYSSQFYVVVLTKKERLLENVYRQFFFPRQTCPTPEYDQAVYRYHYTDDALEFLWCIPSKDTCELLRDNALQVVEDERDLLQYVLNFYDGTLLRYAKQLNNEQPDSLFLNQEN